MGKDSSRTSSQRVRRIVLWSLLGLGLLLALAYLGIGGYAASSVAKVEQDPENPASGPPDVPYEVVRFPARDEDLQLAGWYLPSEGSSRAMVLVHGRDANRHTAISGKLVRLAEALNGAGYAVLLFDLRGHGESEGVQRYTFGVKERRDVLGAVDWLLDRGFAPGRIGVLGVSMGGASAIGAAAQESAIGLLVLDSTLADLKPLIQEKFVEESGLPIWFVPGVLLMNRLMYGYDLTDVRPVDELPLVSPRPVLIIHCTSDKDVKVSQAEDLAQALPYAQTWYVDDCDHAEIYRDHPEEYEQTLLAFLGDHLK